MTLLFTARRGKQGGDRDRRWEGTVGREEDKKKDGRIGGERGSGRG